ncbi:MAG: FtsX-like permease family protein [bacterium]|nr:FtsX-like permease family protein [bacterium]
MRIFMRAWANLVHKKIQTIGTILIFTALLGIGLACLMIYDATDASIAISEKAITNAVTIQPPMVIGAGGSVDTATINETDIPVMVNSDYVEEYNSIVQYMYFFSPKDSTDVYENLHVTAIQNSQYYEPFSSGSFYLKEGKHFVTKDQGKKEVLISSIYASENGLNVGDTLTVHESQLSRELYLERSNDQLLDLEVIGIFTSDDKEALKSAQNWIYMPYSTLLEYWKSVYGEESRLTVHQIVQVVVYLKNSSDIEPYLEYLKKNINVEEISNITEGINYHNVKEVTAGTYNTMDPKELSKLYADTILGEFFYKQWYYVLIDSDWYSMVAAPLEEIRDIMKYTGIIMGIATFFIMALICSFTLRKRNKEFGVLLSIGESKKRIALQILVEVIVLVIVAAGIAMVAAPGITKRYGNQMLSSMAERAELQNKSIKDEYEVKMYGQPLRYAETYQQESTEETVHNNTANVTTKSYLDFRLNVRIVALFFTLLFILVIITMLIQIAYILRLSPGSLIRR